MSDFRLGNLWDWEPFPLDEPVYFDVPEDGFRAVRFEVIASEPVMVKAYIEMQAFLVGAGIGQFEVRLSADRDFSISAHSVAGSDPVVYLRTGRRTQAVPESDEPSYTTIEPRRAGPTAELRRMMQMVRLNSKRREEALQAQLKRLESRLEGRSGDGVRRSEPVEAADEPVPGGVPD